MASSAARTALVPLVVADVYELAGALRRRGEGLAQACGQTQARWQVLSAASEPRTVPRIARRLGVSRQNVQRIANALVAESLARFADNPDHLTSPQLALTEQGQRVLARLTRAAAGRNEALARKLEGLDLASFRKELRRILSALGSKET